MKNLKNCLNTYFEQLELQNIAVQVGNRNEIIYETYRYSKEPIDSKTLFDMASVTKIMATTTLALLAIDGRLLDINDTVSKFFDTPDDKRNMTIKHLLTHTMGIGCKALNKEGNSYENIQDFILSIPSDVEIGREFLYSCPGYILLGKILEKVFGDRLDRLFSKYVAKSIGLKNTCFLPCGNYNFVNSNLNNNEKGIVNDFNCRFLGGIAGNAGLFSNLEDVREYINMVLNYGEPVISKETFNEAIKNHTPDMSESRGLGFVYVDEKYKQTGSLFPKGSIGHCGHTGQSIFADLNSGFYVVILSDATVSVKKKYGYDKYDVVMNMRKDIHNAIYKDLQEDKKYAF